MHKHFSILFEYFRFIGVALLFYLTYSYIHGNVNRLHILSFGVVLLMSGTTAIEGIFLGKESSEKIGYRQDRQYQIQSALANLAIVIASIIVFFDKWGKFADATIATVMLLFFLLSGINHAISLIKHRNFKLINMLRPIFSLIFTLAFLPSIIGAVYLS
ncbi:MAG TPA: hypothetical protein DD381_01840 [Lentisphaeria bacterium]|nr:MAG: hypothetical protein A2X47_10190 [Lentisphaerae bacterium GWF2_38_69]HBM15084.1 hypothetical protein [Lentisphaeria bacterium]